MIIPVIATVAIFLILLSAWSVRGHIEGKMLTIGCLAFIALVHVWLSYGYRQDMLQWRSAYEREIKVANKSHSISP
jgi:hypothetical protein